MMKLTEFKDVDILSVVEKMSQESMEKGFRGYGNDPAGYFSAISFGQFQGKVMRFLQELQTELNNNGSTKK
jgi:hypothetical protein